MAKSKLLSSLRQTYNTALISIKSGIHTDEIIDTFAFKTTRCRFLYGGFQNQCKRRCIATSLQPKSLLFNLDLSLLLRRYC